MQGLWSGVAMFAVGIVAVMAVKPRGGVDSKFVPSEGVAVAIALLLTTLVSSGFGLVAVNLL